MRRRRPCAEEHAGILTAGVANASRPKYKPGCCPQGCLWWNFCFKVLPLLRAVGGTLLLVLLLVGLVVLCYWLYFKH